MSWRKAVEVLSIRIIAWLVVLRVSKKIKLRVYAISAIRSRLVVLSKSFKIN